MLFRKRLKPRKTLRKTLIPLLMVQKQSKSNIYSNYTDFDNFADEQSTKRVRKLGPPNTIHKNAETRLHSPLNQQKFTLAQSTNAHLT